MRKHLRRLWVGDRFLYLAEQLEAIAAIDVEPARVRKQLRDLAVLARAEGNLWNEHPPVVDKDT